MAAYEFGLFRVTEHELKRDGRRVPIDPRPLAVLRYLISRRGALVSDEQLRVSVWSGVYVAHGTIQKAISRLRIALDDADDAPQFVETIPRQGYRFIAFVTDVPHLTEAEKTRSAHVPGDRSRFVRDLTVPDGTIVKVNERFIKRWEIKNVGSVPWVGRFLARLGLTSGPGRLASPERVPIPTTRPGKSCVVEVELVAPRYPGSCYAEWKMVDALGRFCLPRQKGLYVSIDVTE
jgi:DNA-binding winged helix-turn-helix (wHTH) protein